MTDIGQISRVQGAGDEGRVLPPWCDEHHLRSIVVVAMKVTTGDCGARSIEP